MKVFVIVPLFNEERHIASVISGILKENLSLVIVDDGSSDKSLNIVRKIAEHNGNKLSVLEHEVNLGKGAAMKTGADFALSKGADWLIFMDSDGQHSASDLQHFLKVIKEGKYEVIFGSRNLSYGVPLVRYLGNKVASVFVAVLFGVYVSDSICGFRAMSVRAYKKLRWESTGYGVETEMIARVGKKKIGFSEVPVETIYHDSVKGVTILDALAVFVQVIKWKLTLR